MTGEECPRVGPARDVVVLGLGHMGAPIALNLAGAGLGVTGWRRAGSGSLDGVPVAVGQGALRELLGRAAFVVMALSDAPAIEEVLFRSNAFLALRPGAVVIDMGTSGPMAAADHARRLAHGSVAYLDAPVSGGVKGAQDGALTIFVGGAAEVFSRARPVLSALGAPHLMGPTGAGQAAKLANQIIVAGYIAAIAEGLRFAESQGLALMPLIAALQNGFADSSVLRQHAPRMADRDFVTRGAGRLHLKDLRLAEAAMGTGFSSLSNAKEAIARFEHLVERGQGDLDHSAYYLTYLEEDAAP